MWYLHVGTNDVKFKCSQEISAPKYSLGKEVMDTNPSTKFTISAIIPRTDDSNLAAKIKQVNADVQKVCKQNNWGLTSNENINCSHLKSYGVHLNRQGTAILSKNIIGYLKQLNLLLVNKDKAFRY